MGQMRAENNEEGGLDPVDAASLRRAERTDLITLPPGVEGTNCANCLWVRQRASSVADHWCVHPEVNFPVTPRMCCAKWDNEGVKRPWQ